MGHDHDHASGALSTGGRHRRRLTVALALIGGFFIVEVIAGLWTNSLALLSDAGHMFTDVLGLSMALAATTVSARHQSATESGASSQHTFGLYRLEILAAFVNALLLFAVAIWVVVEAVARIDEEPDVAAGPMLAVAVAGLAMNVVVFLMLRDAAAESLNVEGAYLEVVADALGSVGVIVAAVIISLTEWMWVDPVFAAAIGLWILPRTWRLGGRAVRILVQSSPPELDLTTLERDLEGLHDVIEVHDLHVWTLTSGMDAMSAHLMTSESADHHRVLDAARALLVDRYEITHTTFQVEPDSHRGCRDVAW
ncbi:cation diffusion facilitator family transporter [soil metagenome]